MIKKPGKKNILAIIAIVILAVIINLAISDINNHVLDDIYETSAELEQYENSLKIIKDSYEQNLSALNELKKGNCYELHNPLIEEVEEFLENEKNKNASIVINNAKNKGLKSAYVQVIISDSLIVRELIAFNISNLENNITYYEIKTHYQVEPVIGLYYSECFITGELKNPIYDREVKDLINIW